MPKITIGIIFVKDGKPNLYFQGTHKAEWLQKKYKLENFMAWEQQQDDNTIYHVVINEEEQYSIWPEYKDIPQGWRAAGKNGSKQECLDYIKEVWTDMRPLSLRRHMDAASQV